MKQFGLPYLEVRQHEALQAGGDGKRIEYYYPGRRVWISTTRQNYYQLSSPTTRPIANTHNPTTVRITGQIREFSIKPNDQPSTSFKIPKYTSHATARIKTANAVTTQLMNKVKTRPSIYTSD
jgi:hypothetical protein